MDLYSCSAECWCCNICRDNYHLYLGSRFVKACEFSELRTPACDRMHVIGMKKETVIRVSNDLSRHGLCKTVFDVSRDCQILLLDRKQ